MSQDWLYRRPPRVVRKRNPNWRQFYKGVVLTVGLATSTESAFSVTPVGGAPALDIVVETSTALPIALVTKVKEIGLALEFDFSLQVNLLGGGAVVGLTTETDSAFAAVVNMGYDVGLTTETDSALAAPVLRELDAGKVTSIDTALGVIVGVSPIMELGNETDSALVITKIKTPTLAIALEVNEAFGLSEGTTTFVGRADETDTAFGVTPFITGQIGLSDEFDSAFGAIAERRYAIGLTTETDTGFVVTPAQVLIPVDLGWEDDDVTWGGVELGSKDFAPVYLDGVGFKILGFDPTVPLDVFVERRAAVYNKGAALLGLSVWPQIIGPTGHKIQIFLGGHETPEGAIDYEGPYDFTIGEDTFIDFAVAGKYLAIRFESTGVPVWTLQSYDIAYEIIGRH